MTSVLKSVFCPPFLVRSFTLPSFWKLGGWGFHLNRQASASLDSWQLDSESEKRESERDGEKGERECERCLPCDQTMQFLAGTWWALRQWQLTHSPTHGGFPRLPPVFLAIALPLCLLPSIPPLLCFGINVKCLINTAASAAVPYDHRSGSTCQVSLMHAHMHRRAQKGILPCFLHTRVCCFPSGLQHFKAIKHVTTAINGHWWGLCNMVFSWVFFFFQLFHSFIYKVE